MLENIKALRGENPIEIWVEMGAGNGFPRVIRIQTKIPIRISMAIPTPIKVLGLKEMQVEVIIDTVQSIQLPGMLCHHEMGKINNMEQ